jgi:hypothetical protein
LSGDECTRPLPPAVRERLSLFLVNTERYAAPALDNQIDDEISKLMLSFRSARTISPEEAEATVRTFVEVMRGLPLWAIRDGFGKISRGEVEGVSLDYPPSAPRLRKVVTDEMIPIRADRSEVTRILAAREVPPENPEMAKRVEPLVKGGLNRMQQKFGPNYGLGGVLQTNDAGFLPAAAQPTERQTMTPEQLTEHYRTHDLQFRQKSKQQRNGDRNGDETFHDDDGREAVAR